MMENYIPMTAADGAMFASTTSQTMAVILAAELTLIFGYLAVAVAGKVPATDLIEGRACTFESHGVDP